MQFYSFYSGQHDVLIHMCYVILFSIMLLIFTPQKNKLFLKQLALVSSFFLFLMFLYVWLCFNKSSSKFQFVKKVLWFDSFNINLVLGLDGISLLFLFLTTLLIPLCFLWSWDSVECDLKEFCIFFFLLELFLVLSFCVLDLLLFYIFFESVLIPMFFIIGVWGSRDRKVLAAYYFFFYTLVGSLLALLAILYVYLQIGTTDYQIMLSFSLSSVEQKPLWLAIFLAFASKVPMMPFHLWLPEAHVEAPTAGSVILAGVLLKLGTYGFVRFLLPVFFDASSFFVPLVYLLSLIGILYASLTAIRQSDFKRIIAYTSIAHMNLVVVGIFSFNQLGIKGSIIQSLSHGFVASALFFIIGVVYDRYKTRIVYYYGGLASIMPMYAFIFLFFTMANISFPGTSSFVGELMLLTASFKVSYFVTVLASTSVVVGGCYSLWLLNRIIYGNLKIQYLRFFIDLSWREMTVFFPLLAGTLVLGLHPRFFIDFVTMSATFLVEFLD